MTNFWDAGNIAAWCALGLSILTPIATSISNNRFQLKMKRVELFVSSELKDIDEFISVVGNAIRVLVNLVTVTLLHLSEKFMLFLRVPTIKRTIGSD